MRTWRVRPLAWLPAAQASVFGPLARALPGTVTPNALTTFRLILALVLAFLFRADALWPAAAAYALAALSDPLDGELARHRGLTSSLGARFDPSVDKILHAVVFVAFFRSQPLLLGTLLGLDVLLVLMSAPLVLFRQHRPWDFTSSVFGKAKMTAQAVGVGLLFWNALAVKVAVPVGIVRGVLIAAIVLSVLSMASYARKLLAA